MVSTDASAQMTGMARAGAEARNLTNVKFATVSGDADGLAEAIGVEEGSVDVVVMCFSLMFVPDKQKCLESVAGLLKKNGKLLVAVLKELGLMTLISEAFSVVTGKAPAGPPPLNPLALRDPSALDFLVAGAGLAPASVDALQYTSWVEVVPRRASRGSPPRVVQF